jgi:hypothetical protein
MTLEVATRQPVRVQFRKGEELPAGVVFCARPSKWGNQFTHIYSPTTALIVVGSRAEAVQRHRERIEADPELVAQIKAELAGKDLACYCGLGELCHVDTYLEIAAANVPPVLTEYRAMECPRCLQSDYMLLYEPYVASKSGEAVHAPVRTGWRRCWHCGRRWGPTDSADPGDPPGIVLTGRLLGRGIAAGQGRRRR